MHMQKKPGLAERCASHRGRTPRQFMKHMLGMGKAQLSDSELLAGHLDFTQASLRECVELNHLDAKTRGLFLGKARQADSLLRWLENNPKTSFKGLKTHLSSGKAGKPSELVSILSELTGWRYSSSMASLKCPASDIVENVSFLSEETKYVLDMELKGLQFNMAERYSFEFGRALNPVDYAVITPPDWKIPEWVSLAQLKRIFGVANAEQEALRASGRLSPVASFPNPRKHIALSFFSREEAEHFAFPHKFGQITHLDLAKVESFRKKLIANSHKRGVAADIKEALAPFLAPSALASSGMGKRELLEASRKCIQCSEIEEATPFIKQILPRLVAALAPIFGPKAPSALLLIADIKRFPEDGRFSLRARSDTEVARLRDSSQKDESWPRILKEVEDYCRVILPNKRSMVGAALQRFGYEETGDGVYIRKLTGELFTGSDSGLVLITANLSTPFKVEIRMNGEKMGGYNDPSLTERSREKALDGLAILKHLKVSLREFADAMFNRITFKGTRDFYDGITNGGAGETT